VAAVEAFLQQGQSKTALWRAKQAHKRWGTPESERLLLRVYAVRIEELTGRGLSNEAEALMKNLRERFPQASQTLLSTELKLGIPCDNLGSLLKRLVDPTCAADEVQTIEDTIRRNLKDPADLANAAELPAEHPWKREAAALARAFEKVTSGPASDEDVALPEISRRSPLAPWKVLVRAIAHFYRREDEACLACLDRVPEQTAVARLASALRIALTCDPKGRENLSPTLRGLADRIGGHLGGFSEALRNLDARFAERRAGRIVRAIEEAVRACQRECPELLVRLRQHISVRGFMAGIDRERIRRAMGGSSKKDAFFWRLLAQATELNSGTHAEAKVVVCELLEHFRVQAIREGTFAENGPETVALYSMMLDLQESIPPDLLARVHRSLAAGPSLFEVYYGDQPEEIRAAGRRAERADALKPEKLYERICTLAPDAEIYRCWFHRFRGKKEKEWQQAEDVALRWHRAFPRDVRPLLSLMELAEERGALKRALGWVEQAERLDGLHAGVRDARMRLWTATALRHLKQHKPHLLEKDIEALDALPSMRGGDRPAFLSALRWACAIGTGDRERAELHRTRIDERLGSSAATWLLLETLSDVCGGMYADLSTDFSPALDVGGVAQAAGRALLLAADVGLPVHIPQTYENALVRDLSGKPAALDTAALCAIAEAAVASNRLRLGYLATAHGLQRPNAPCGRLLLLRARCLPPLMFQRATDLKAAAIAFAREARDEKTLDEALGSDGRRRSRYADLYTVTPTNLDRETAIEILGIEKARKDFLDSPNQAEPWTHRNRPDAFSPEFGFPGFGDDFGDDADEEWEEDFEEDAFEEDDQAPGPWDLPLPKGIPATLLELLKEAFRKHGKGGRSPEEVLRKMDREDPDLTMKILSAFLDSEAAKYDLPPGFADRLFGANRPKDGRSRRP